MLNNNVRFDKDRQGDFVLKFVMAEEELQMPASYDERLLWVQKSYECFAANVEERYDLLARMEPG